MDGAQLNFEGQDALFEEYDAALADLNAAKDAWVKVSPADRIALLQGMKDGIMKVAEGWAEGAWLGLRKTAGPFARAG